ncbi:MULTISPECIES: efflux RND transporter periplasmic adaptor subunit [Pseudoalteromonas]|uniref:Transporter n=1 Tax=Pseudoalteromonas ruthenica TaxID=151081 RepID=A0A0F4PRI8_9GAMM|nr:MULTISPECIES: efflux RND transporter periplasmic adaptor subunit [Pseudoalteromonas]KJY98085.1 transporter [Pseudoalteromonas ruthenica]KJZ02152.1 transporter [Pseudoalteromonas ruthenica]MCG7569586.1 efflux RND transporter periplasmic adaptor subunit [Pseudoalteromonas sp. CNC9-20]TMO90314.1 MexE family multidrug efflux RND transporter periplasmic adaptor subunit [Pseudoalteromonas ruthenica]TMO91978.1 MexE family multidrug efflux RND transporter periplasmic adaptor subunit [Pseudoalteromo
MRLAQTTAVLLSAALILAGCSEQASQQATPQGPMMTIDVASVQMQPAQRWHSFTTRLEAPSKVALKSRVSGQITQTFFSEGEQVQKGQPLFQIDPRPFAAQVDRLKAQLISNSAALAQAEREAQRAQRLLAKNAMSTEQAGQRDAILKQRQAERSALKAELQAAELDLAFATIRSPINGVISRAEITAGNHITAGQDVLTRIVSNDRVYAYFNVDERTWYQDFAGINAQSQARVILQNLRKSAEGEAITGRIDFIDNEINARTGTLRIRAVFDAVAHQLKPGAFARINLAAQGASPTAIVPERAIGTDLKNRFVLTVDGDNTLQYRRVQLGERYGEFRAIQSGLEPGELVVANGPARVGPGMTVSVNEIPLNFSDTRFVMAPAQGADNALSAAR